LFKLKTFEKWRNPIMNFIEMLMYIPEEFVEEIKFSLETIVYNEINRKHQIIAAETVAKSTKTAIKKDIEDFKNINNI